MFVAYQMVADFVHANGTNAPRRERIASLTVIVIFLSVVSLISWRAHCDLNVPGHPDARHWALQDFRDAVYYPALAFLEGNNPYDADAAMRHHPVGRPLPLYSPLNLVIHLPFAALPFERAEFAYYVFTVLLTLVLARLTLELCGLPGRPAYVFGLAALVVLSRPGQMNLLLGQVTLQCVIATYLALYCARTRPWLAGLGLALSTFKPSFGVPLAVLMLCRRDVRAVVIGLTVAGVLSAAIAGVLVHAAGGVAPLFRSALQSQQGFADQVFNDPLLGPFRLDTVALLARLLRVDLGSAGELIIGIAVLSLGAFAVWHLAQSARDDSEVRPVSATLICLTVLACTYHQTYDWLLMTLPVTALMVDRWVPRGASHPVLRWSLLALLLVPAANYLATATAMDRLGITGGARVLVTSLNAGAVLLIFVTYVWLALRSRRTSGLAFQSPGRTAFRERDRVCTHRCGPAEMEGRSRASD